jgi:hypothetical protein
MNASSFIAALGWYRREIFDTIRAFIIIPIAARAGRPKDSPLIMGAGKLDIFLPFPLASSLTY